MRGISYLAMVEYFGPNQKTFKQFFTNKRARTESPKTYAQADEWVAGTLREYGTDNCRCTVSKVMYCITG